MWGEQKAYENRYTAWRASAQHPGMFRRVAVVGEENGRLALRMFNAGHRRFGTCRMARGLDTAREFIATRLSGRNNGPLRTDISTLIDYPRFRSQPDPTSGRPVEQDWLLLDVDSQRAGTVILPELLSQYLDRRLPLAVSRGGGIPRESFRGDLRDRLRPGVLVCGTTAGERNPVRSATAGPGPRAWTTSRRAGPGRLERFRTRPLAALGVAAKWFARNHRSQRPPPRIWRFPEASCFCCSPPAPRWRSSREERSGWPRWRWNSSRAFRMNCARRSPSFEPRRSICAARWRRTRRRWNAMVRSSSRKASAWARSSSRSCASPAPRPAAWCRNASRFPSPA